MKQKTFFQTNYNYNTRFKKMTDQFQHYLQNMIVDQQNESQGQVIQPKRRMLRVDDGQQTYLGKVITQNITQPFTSNIVEPIGQAFDQNIGQPLKKIGTDVYNWGQQFVQGVNQMKGGIQQSAIATRDLGKGVINTIGGAKKAFGNNGGLLLTAGALGAAHMLGGQALVRLASDGVAHGLRGTAIGVKGAVKGAAKGLYNTGKGALWLGKNIFYQRQPSKSSTNTITRKKIRRIKRKPLKKPIIIDVKRQDVSDIRKLAIMKHRKGTQKSKRHHLQNTNRYPRQIVSQKVVVQQNQSGDEGYEQIEQDQQIESDE